MVLNEVIDYTNRVWYKNLFRNFKKKLEKAPAPFEEKLQMLNFFVQIVRVSDNLSIEYVKEILNELIIEEIQGK